ncbi:hypothetical protein CKJ89_38415, partial [Klebsiella pneumoniae]
LSCWRRWRLVRLAVLPQVLLLASASGLVWTLLHACGPWAMAILSCWRRWRLVRLAVLPQVLLLASASGLVWTLL